MEGVDKSTKLKLQCHNHNHRHQHLNYKHKQEVHLVVEVVPLVEAVLHNLLEEEQTLLNNNQH
jgi:hypothetical protein